MSLSVKAVKGTSESFYFLNSSLQYGGKKKMMMTWITCSCNGDSKSSTFWFCWKKILLKKINNWKIKSKRKIPTQNMWLKWSLGGPRISRGLYMDKLTHRGKKERDWYLKILLILNSSNLENVWKKQKE